MKDSFWKNRKILTSITSFRTNPLELIKEADELKINELALFLTGLNPEERKSLYGHLEKSSIKKITCVHIKSDIKKWELDYLIKKFSTKAFNVHTSKEYPLKNDISKYKRMIFIENTSYFLDESEIKNYGGVCIDVSHLEEDKILAKDLYEHNLSVVKKFKVGFNHLSPLNIRKGRKSIKEWTEDDIKIAHVMDNLNQFDYLKNYPEEIFGPYLVLETRNNLYEQVKMKEYIEKLLEK